GGNGFVIKKGGETSESIYMDKGSLKSKVFSFIKTGNNFILMNGEQRIIGFHDPAMLRRTTGDLTIYLRPGSKCRIKDMKLSVHHRDAADPPINRFVSFSKSPNKFFLLSPVRRFELDEKNGVYAAYELLDLSDMKQKIDQITEANKRLQSYSNRSRLMVGESKVLSTVLERAEKLAASNATVLIEGATGTGKELMAQYIHTSSTRSADPFLRVDCSTIPSSLIESSLFGHEKGAFTGATTRIRGLFEQADGGTLFIDEAGNLTMDVQAKLLQFLENRTFSPLGGVKSLTVDVRVIVASNLSLATLVKAGSFREDLFHRIAVFIVTMPNLRDRLEDIPSLANHFLTELNRKYKKGIRYISADVYRKLNQHNWPGNIRELKNVLERAYFFTEDEKISEIDIENYNVTNKENNNRKKRTNLSFLKEKPELLISTANKHNGNLTATAAELGIAHRTLYAYIKKNNIKPDMLRHQ
ncbi:MAG: sigma-54-dependent Fis family transcriptional regulator, partial [Fibrobacteres bacterium]|nr:sigma-54-dependent Fis family transcriptional regulator [Fibrobacterota bacterium]